MKGRPRHEHEILAIEEVDGEDRRKQT